MSISIFYEDCLPGLSFDLGSTVVPKEQVLRFAAAFDPQPFHLDEDAGKASILGGLSASGWHTASMVMRLLVDQLLSRSSCQGSPGVKSLKWMKPVFPGDTLHAKADVLEKRTLLTKPHLGIVTFDLTAAKADGTPVMHQVIPILFGKRDTSEALNTR
ncbi:MaoC family dehydratase [Roseibium litorale]|uniref:MaoC family dehydratase n=1 Tax=Roseibium litorale TaxID=2803841 RepID=A0ABR9CKM0_9HYPH|nr:MaoC family dehydratase [Roseibium litorale]MBD8891376.1 MaoC family dehydratase [Roseibium litorale]